MSSHRIVSVWHSDDGRSRWYAVPTDRGMTRALGPFDTKAAALAASEGSKPEATGDWTNVQDGQTASLF